MGLTYVEKQLIKKMLGPNKKRKFKACSSQRYLEFPAPEFVKFKSFLNFFIPMKIYNIKLHFCGGVPKI